MKIDKIMKAIVLPIFIGATLVSCIDDYKGIEPDNGGSAGRPTIVLTFDTNDSETRALTGETTPFTDTERNLNKVDVFFYKDRSTAPVKVESISEKKHGEKAEVIIMEEEALELFGIASLEEPGSCIVYAVANVSDDDYKNSGIPKSSATVEQLKKLKATTPSFAGIFDGFAMFTKNPDGDVLSYDGDGHKAEGEVKFKNLAAKIDVFVKFAENLKDSEGNPLQVATSKGLPTTEVHLLNGVTAVGIAGFNKELLGDEDYYSVRGDHNNRRGIAELTKNDPFYAAEKGSWRWGTSAPYYSYPNEWANNPLEQHRTSLILKVDWTTKDDPEVVDDMNTLTTYYSVPINLGNNEDNHKLESNRYYRLKLNINSIGGENFGEPLEIEGEWEVLDWGYADIEADLRQTRYLEVYQKQKDRDGLEYTAVVNGNDMLITIPFDSSHEAYIESVKIEYTSFEAQDSFNWNNKSDNGRNSIIYTGGKYNTDDFDSHSLVPSYFERKELEDLTVNKWQGAYIDNVNKNITIRHRIGPCKAVGTHYEPNTDPTYQFTSYLITIQLNHFNENGFGKLGEITIMHHPPIYVEAEVNAGYNDYDYKGAAEIGSSPKYEVDRWEYGLAMHHHGFVRINENNPRNAKYGGLRGITKANGAPTNWGDNTTENPIMYIINVTQIEKSVETELGTRFHIKDPRSNINQASTILGGDSWYGANHHYVNGVMEYYNDPEKKYTPKYYYPTEDAPVPENMYALAPRFRIASAFGITPAKSVTNKDEEEITLDEAKKRCATYQEYGYPAGRWRLPTIGEIKFVQYLSNKNLVPKVFQRNADYVTAFGVYRFPSDGQEYPNGKDGRIRCVYDDWYWVKEEDGSPDNIKPNRTNYNPTDKTVDIDFTAMYNGGYVFVWGDKEKRSPQTPVED